MKSYKNNQPAQDLTHGSANRTAWLACSFINTLAKRKANPKPHASLEDWLAALLCQAWKKRDHKFFSDIPRIFNQFDKYVSIAANPELAHLWGYYMEHQQIFDAKGKVFTQTEVSKICECSYRTAGRIKKAFDTIRGGIGT